MQLLDYIIANVSPLQFYNEFIEKKYKRKNQENINIPCLFHYDKKPSLSLNVQNGKWYCHGCKIGENSIVHFQSQLNKCSIKDACYYIYNKHVRKIIPKSKVIKYHKNLLLTPSILKYLTHRKISNEIIKEHLIGFDDRRITIPIYNKFGFCINIRRYIINSKANSEEPKVVNYTDSTSYKYGSPVGLFPIKSLLNISKDEQIVLCEGEMDTLSLLTTGVPAVTMTGGAGSWAKEEQYLFELQKVVIAYDNDKAGTIGKNIVCKALQHIAKEIRILEIPHSIGKDVNDWILNDAKMRSSIEWYKIINNIQPIIINNENNITFSRNNSIPLDKASLVKYRESDVIINGLIAGKDSCIYSIPSKIEVIVKRNCHNKNCSSKRKGKSKDVFIKAGADILNIIDKPNDYIKKFVTRMAGYRCTKCEYRTIKHNYINVERVIVVPTIDSKSEEYLRKICYYTGHGLKVNKAYKLFGVPTEHPETQESTLIFSNQEPLQDQIDTFKITPEMKLELDCFKCRQGKPILKHLLEIAEWQSKKVTKIYGRADLHIAIDLVYHSAKSFIFINDIVKRGMLDILIMGDSKCGKGAVAEGLMKFYSLGDIASGENCSISGLVGGCEATDSKRYMIKWGIIVLNNNRLVIIDEISALNHEEIAHLSRIRSEGVAEIFKIAREVTEANTRLIWIGNPKDGKQMAFYDHGVKAIRDLIGASEDISRFDFALIVSSDEVSSDLINSIHDNYLTNECNFTKEKCKNLILWAWSRKHEQIRFSKLAVKKALETSKLLGTLYSAEIPLIQIENVRIKIAKIAVAIAARCFSTNKSGECIIVLKKHIVAAVKWLNNIYSKKNTSYNTFSQLVKERKIISNLNSIEEMFDREPKELVDGLFTQSIITSSLIKDYTGKDNVASGEIIGRLVRTNCIKQIKQGFYMKSTVFTDWLKERRLNKEKKNGESIVL